MRLRKLVMLVVPPLLVVPLLLVIPLLVAQIRARARTGSRPRLLKFSLRLHLELPTQSPQAPSCASFELGMVYRLKIARTA
jgi:hypothetical protein